MVDSARQIAEALKAIPCIGDGDTGYGNAVNVKRTVKGYAQVRATCMTTCVANIHVSTSGPRLFVCLPFALCSLRPSLGASKTYSHLLHDHDTRRAWRAS